MAPSDDPGIFCNHLFDSNKQPTKVLDDLLRGIACYIIENIGDVTEKYLKPQKMAAFYKAVGGNYDSLFVSVPNESISWIYASIGCQHLLLPTNDHFVPPSIPSLTVAGFVRWQSIEILLGPEEHVPFIQRSLQLFDIRHPETNKPFPKDLPIDAFPLQPDPEIVRWHKKCAQKLRKCAIKAANEIPDSPPRILKSTSVYPRPRLHEFNTEEPAKTQGLRRDNSTRDSHQRESKRRSKSADDGSELEDCPRNFDTTVSRSASSHARAHARHDSYNKEKSNKKKLPDNLLFDRPPRRSSSPDRHRRSTKKEHILNDVEYTPKTARGRYTRAKSYESSFYAEKDHDCQRRCQNSDRTENLRWRDLDGIAAVLKSRRNGLSGEKADILQRVDRDRGGRYERKWEPNLNNALNPRDVGRRQSSYENLTRRERHANQMNESRRRNFRVTDTGDKYFGSIRTFNVRNISPISSFEGRRCSVDD